jgi:hypothetical protein
MELILILKIIKGYPPIELVHNDHNSLLKIIEGLSTYREKQYLKKINYQRIIKYIPEHSAHIMLKPNKAGNFNRMGSNIILCQLKLQNESINDVYNFVKESCPKVFDYLGIIDIDDFCDKINSYNNYN